MNISKIKFRYLWTVIPFIYACAITSKNFQTLRGVQTGSYYRQNVIEKLSYLDAFIQMIFPFSTTFLVSILDIVPFKILNSVLDSSIAYAISANLLFFISITLFYSACRKYIGFPASFFLTMLLFLTPNELSFHQYLTSPSLNFVGGVGFRFLSFPFPIGIIFGLSLFLFVSSSSLIKPKEKYKLLAILLFLQIYVHPLNAIICGTWMLWDYFSNPGSPKAKSANKIKFYGLIIFVLFASLQLVAVLFSSNAGVIGGFVGPSEFKIGFFDLIFFAIMPLVLIQISTKFINISWLEIIYRFNFVAVLFLVKIFAVVCSKIFEWQNPYEVLTRNGYIDFIDALIYIPVIYVYSSNERSNKILKSKFRLFAWGISKSKKILNLILGLLITLLLLQSIPNFQIKNYSDGDVCIQLNPLQLADLQKFVIQVDKLSYNEIERRLILFTKSNIPPDQYKDFFDSPIKEVSSRILTSNECALSGYGYLILNGFSQSEASMKKSSEILEKLKVAAGNSN